MWQDLVLSASGLVFALLLVPTLLDEDASVPLWTSVPTALTLVVMSFTYSTLSLYGAALFSTFTAGIWFLIALYRHP